MGQPLFLAVHCLWAEPANAIEIHGYWFGLLQSLTIYEIFPWEPKLKLLITFLTSPN